MAQKGQLPPKGKQSDKPVISPPPPPVDTEDRDPNSRLLPSKLEYDVMDALGISTDVLYDLLNSRAEAGWTLNLVFGNKLIFSRTRTNEGKSQDLIDAK